MIIKMILQWAFGWIKGLDAVMLVGIILTFFWFDVLWYMSTTFRSLNNPQLYLITLASSLLLLAPWMLTRSRTVGFIVIFFLSLLFEANLIYCRSYYTAIPPRDYLLVGNMKDFTDSILPNFRWGDIGFIIILIAVTISGNLIKYSKKRNQFKQYLSLNVTFILISFIYIISLGGFYKAYEKVTQEWMNYTSGVPTYTIAGHLIFKIMEGKRLGEPDPQQMQAVENWIELHREKYTPNQCCETRKNVVLIICESFESWPIGLKLDGKEVTPYINSLLKDSTTFYAPKVMTQVCGGNSIDGQLIYTTGLLPTSNRVYSMNYADRIYPSLNKILKKERNAKSILLTTDRPTTWNMLAVARAFEYDTVIHHSNWKMDEIMHKNLTDGSFFRQAVAKLKNENIWPENSSAMLTIITYSGHLPFILNDELKDPKFDISKINLPNELENFILTTHYVDSQLHTIIDYIQSRKDSDDTMIVILGDHEGLRSKRKELIEKSEFARNMVGNERYTPLIILNSPIVGKFEMVLGQVDVFPTLLDLLGVNNDQWRGMGISLMDSSRPNIAFSSIPPAMDGDASKYSKEEIDHLKYAQSISELIIIHNYFDKKILHNR